MDIGCFHCRRANPVEGRKTEFRTGHELVDRAERRPCLNVTTGLNQT